MAVTRQKKEEVLGEVKEALSGAGSVVFVTFRGLPVADSSEMRNTLRKEGVGYKVAKKTLIRRALSELSVAGEVPEFPGELAIAWGEDLVVPAREIHNFAKTRKEQLGIVGGIFEGKYMNAAEMTEIATIPSRETLYAQSLNLINSPIQQYVMALDQIRQKKEATA
jgi:large subunit ribosomal protein L10